MHWKFRHSRPNIRYAAGIPAQSFTKAPKSRHENAIMAENNQARARRRAAERVGVLAALAEEYAAFRTLRLAQRRGDARGGILHLLHQKNHAFYCYIF